MKNETPTLTVYIAKKNISGWGFQAKKKTIYTLNDIYKPVNPFGKYYKDNRTIQWVLDNDPIELQNFLYRNSCSASANDAMKRLIYPWYNKRREFEDNDIAFILWKGIHFPRKDLIIKWDELATIEISIGQIKTTLWQHIRRNSKGLMLLHKSNNAHLSKKLIALIECETINERIELLNSFK